MYNRSSDTAIHSPTYGEQRSAAVGRRGSIHVEAQRGDGYKLHHRVRPSFGEAPS